MFDPRDLIAALDAARIEYVVIGGFAVAAHGYVRATKDPGTKKRTAGRQQDLDDLSHLGVSTTSSRGTTLSVSRRRV